MFYSERIETMGRGDLDALIEERIHYTVKYASEHSPFYRKWFVEHGINPSDIRTHEDLRDLPVVSGKTVSWSAAFFGLRSPLIGLVIIFILCVAILVTLLGFMKISKTAGILLIPYILWVSFAAALNFFIWMLNS